MDKPVVITGGAGFIGSHLAARLKAQGRSIILIDNLSTGRQDNITPLLDDQCRLIEGDVTTVLAGSPDLLRDAACIYHLAASVGVKLVVEEPIQVIRNNIDESAAVLEAAAQARVPVLIASTSEVYGKSTQAPFRETQDIVVGPPTSPRWCYALSKAIDEHLALAYAAKRGVGVVVTRFFNAIGPRQLGRYGMVVPRFVDWAVRNEPLVIHGDGRQTRAFCDVRDTVRACQALLENPAHHGQVFNVGADREITIEELADRVIARTGSTAGKRFISYEEAYDKQFEDMVRRVPDISKLREAIGFDPSYSLDDTLDDLIVESRARVDAGIAN